MFSNWLQKGIMTIKDTWDRGKRSFMTFGELVRQYNLTPSLRHEEEYKMRLDSLPTTLIANVQNWDENNKNRNTDNDTFSLTEVYKVTLKNCYPNMFIIDWCLLSWMDLKQAIEFR